MEWILLIISFIITTYLYIFKKKFFNEHKGFIEFAIVLFTVFFTIYQVKSSADDFNKITDRMEGIVRSAEDSKKSLKQLEKSLDDLPSRVDSFSSSILQLNDVVEHQKDKLESTLNNFSSTILAFQNSIDDMRTRFDRKPDLKIDIKRIDTDSANIVTKIVVANHGNSLADLYLVRFQIDDGSLVSFKIEGATETMKQANMRCFQIDLDHNYITPDPLKPLVFESEIKMNKTPYCRLKIFVYYKAPFGNDGNVSEIFITPKLIKSGELK